LTHLIFLFFPGLLFGIILKYYSPPPPCAAPVYLYNRTYKTLLNPQPPRAGQPKNKTDPLKQYCHLTCETIVHLVAKPNDTHVVRVLPLLEIIYTILKPVMGEDPIQPSSDRGAINRHRAYVHCSLPAHFGRADRIQPRNISVAKEI
jgi:hypothetical protein